MLAESVIASRSQRLVSYSILNSQYLCSFCVYICIFSCAHRHRHRHIFRFLTPSFLFCSLSILFCSLSISFCSLNILFYSLNILFFSLSILFSAQNRTRHVHASVYSHSRVGALKNRRASKLLCVLRIKPDTHARAYVLTLE